MLAAFRWNARVRMLGGWRKSVLQIRRWMDETRAPRSGVFSRTCSRNPVHDFMSCLLKIRFHIVLPPRSMFHNQPFSCKCSYANKYNGVYLSLRGKVVYFHVMKAFILNLGDRWRWFFNFTPRPLYPEKEPPISVKGRGWIRDRSSLDNLVKEKVSSAEVRMPDLPAREYVSVSRLKNGSETTVQGMCNCIRALFYRESTKNRM
jgi:hypothetical protein